MCGGRGVGEVVKDWGSGSALRDLEWEVGIICTHGSGAAAPEPGGGSDQAVPGSDSSFPQLLEGGFAPVGE